MKLFPLTSERLFKGTVFLLGIPAVLLLAITILIIFIRLVSGPVVGRSGGFVFALTRSDLMIAALVLLGIFLLLSVLGRALVRRHERRSSDLNR